MALLERSSPQEAADSAVRSTAVPTLWGLNPREIHDRFWAARGVQVVRPGQQEPVRSGAELYLLMDAGALTLFWLEDLVDTISWLKPQVLFVRLHAPYDQGYQERVITDGEDRFVRFERVYGTANWRLGRVALTQDASVARAWHDRSDTDRESGNAWRTLRRSFPVTRRMTLSVEGRVYNRAESGEATAFLDELQKIWKRPDATIHGLRALADEVWAEESASAEPQARFIGPVWVGFGRSLMGHSSVVGPAILWDDTSQRREAPALNWEQIVPGDILARPVRLGRVTSVHRVAKRAFDIAFALMALTLTLPLYPLIMAAIWLEDGRPFFFAHRRESMGGREFPCLKFRTMRKDAEEIKQRLLQENQADGPQFFIKDDPRISRVGKFLRKVNLDEIPQFWNVLVGHMSVVGPRPSPHKENQFCPPWREARLSVRPGVTGLWQVKRSREVGRDFQEWIRYDIEYVEDMRWRTDFYIIFMTILQCLKIR